MSASPRIVCDHGERASGIPELLRRRGADVELTRLAGGDYLLLERLALERKASDFLDSLLSGRLEAQLDRLAEAYGRAVLLIEGDDWRGDRRLRAPMLGRFYHRMLVRGDISVLYSPSTKWTAKLLFALATAAQAGADTPVISQAAYAPAVRKPEDVLRALPGVGPVGTRRLAASFENVRGIINASQAELIAAIGPARGERIYRLFKAPFDT